MSLMQVGQRRRGMEHEPSAHFSSGLHIPVVMSPVTSQLTHQVPVHVPDGISALTGGEEDAGVQSGPHVQSYMVATDQVRSGPKILCAQHAACVLLTICNMKGNADCCWFCTGAGRAGVTSE